MTVWAQDKQQRHTTVVQRKLGSTPRIVGTVHFQVFTEGLSVVMTSAIDRLPGAFQALDYKVCREDFNG